ncbi:MAG: Gldg family protein [Candidatus Poribacteria bacterium]|nr:Gldg family protein [Candidatus Poribacteria bacterium]MDE0503624.1 Gldg family protein [Candidatus Poribacteria bacterium]
MAKKTWIQGSNALAFALVILLILAVVNFLSYRRFVRADLTEDKRYTISDSSRNVLNRMDDVVTVNAYYSREPAQVADRRRKVRDVLDEYRAFSNKLQINFIDPAGFKEGEKQELRFRGIHELQVNVIEKDRAEVANVYMSVAVAYGGKEEVLPEVTDTATLEYDLTSAILKVTTKEAKTVGFLAGHDELDIDGQNFSMLRAQLDKNQNGQFNVRKVTIEDGEAIGQDVSTLVIAGPKSVLTEREKYEIDQHIMRGGRAVFLIDSVRTQETGLQATPLSTGLNDLLEHYGVKLGNNLVLDQSNEMTRFSAGRSITIQPYPYFISVLNRYRYRTGESSEGLSNEHIITSELEKLVLPWASSLELLPIEGETIQATMLARTSSSAWTTQSPYNLDPSAPTNQFNPSGSTSSAFTVAAALSGVFKSFYAGKEIPTPEIDESDSDETPQSASEDRETKNASEPTQIVVVGNSKFLEQGRPDGQLFFLNTIDWLTLGEDLISIRSHAITDRPLREVSESEKTFVWFICVCGVPMIVIAFGLLRYYLRRRAKRLVETYGTV